MKIALAQIKCEIGEVTANITNHLKVVEKASAEGARLIVFPELSLTGYAPELAKSLAMKLDDLRLTPFAMASDRHQISIGVGVPIQTDDKPQIGLVIFEPGEPIKIYSKQYLHEDELPYFSAGKNYTGTIAGRDDIALCVCYELSIDQHAEAACERNASIYLASVAKTPSGVASASNRLAALSQSMNIVSMMCNCVGICEGQTAGGGSAAWDAKGALVQQLGAKEEALLTIDINSPDQPAEKTQLNEPVIRLQLCDSTYLDTVLDIAKSTFIETFGPFNDPGHFDAYVDKAFAKEQIASELAAAASDFYLLYTNEELAGYLKLNRPPDQTDIQDPDSLEIERIYVKSPFHGQGLGKVLFDKALEEAKKDNLKYIWLGVWEKNEKALKFYRDRGFYKFAEHPFKLGDDLQTDELMRLDL